MSSLAYRRKLDAQTRRAALLGELFAAVTSATTEAEVLAAAARSAAEWVGDACSILLVSPDGAWLDLAAVKARDVRAERLIRSLGLAVRLRADEGVAGTVLRTGQAFSGSITTPAEAPKRDFAAFIERFPLRSLVAVPLATPQATIGVLELARYRSPEQYAPDDIEFVAAVAARTALAYANLRAHREEVERNRSEAERKALLAEFLSSAAESRSETALLEHLVGGVQRATNSACLFYRATGDGSELDVLAIAGYEPDQEARLTGMFAARRWRSGEGIAGTAFARDETIVEALSESGRQAYLDALPDDRRAAMEALDLRAMIAVPVRAEHTPIGVLGLVRFGPGAQPFAAADIAFAQELAAGANVALARLALIAERDRDTRRAQMLAAFVEAASGAADEREVLEQLAQQASDAVEGSLAIYAVDDRAGELEVVAIKSHDDVAGAFRTMYARQRWRLGEGFMGRAIASAATVFVPYLSPADRESYLASLPEDRRPEMAARDLRAIVAVPLRDGSRVVGVLTLARYGETASPLTEADRAFATELAGHANAAIARLTLGRERAREAERKRLLAEFLAAAMQANDEAEALEQLAAQVARALNAACGIYRPTRDGRELDLVGAASAIRTTAEEMRATYSGRRAQVGEGTLGKAFATGQSLIVEWLSDEAFASLVASLEPEHRALVAAQAARSLIAVPIRARGAVIGVLSIARVGLDATAFTRDDLAYAEEYAIRTTVALERLALIAERARTASTLEAILAASPLPIVTIDAEMRVTFWNAAAESVYGWTAPEVMGKPPPFAPEREPNALREAFERVRAGEPVETEARRRTKDGREIDIRFIAAPLLDETGRFHGSLGISQDVTDQKRLEAELLQAQKMETVGRLAGGVAHDFNNILTAIIGYSDMARSMAHEPEVERALSTVKAAAERAAGLTQQLLAFSRRQMLQPREVDANEVILRMEPILRRLIGEDVELVASITPDAGSVLVDPTQLEQVILNLAVNARDAMPDGGRLVLRTETTHFNGDHRHLEMAPGDYVVISVADTGHGMDEETRAHIFEPFFTTKEVGKGTGLGLSTTYGIVRQSGGYIWVYSEPGRGTTFKLYFPRVRGTPEIAEELAAPVVARGGRILLVEDEGTLRDLARIVLARRGYDVLAARHPAEALDLAAAAAKLDLLVTDVVMPGMTGIELARRLRTERPDLAVIFMSGYSEDVTDAAGSMARRFLAKPFTPDSLLRAVDEALSAERRKA